MSEAVSIYLPHWSTDLLLRRRRAHTNRQPANRRDAAHPAVLLYEQHAGRQLVVCCCPHATKAGVRPGLTVAQARALLGAEPLLCAHQPHRDLERLEALARWALHYSPLAAMDPPDGLLIDIRGCERLFGGVRALLDRMGAEIAALRLHVRVAVAPTFACAWALARYGRQASTIVDDDGAREALAALPVEALRLGSNVVQALGEVGIEHVGHLLELPRSSLAMRFGANGPWLVRRLDLALGRAPETINPVRLVEPLKVERVFDGPVKQIEAVMLTADALVEQLAHRLEQLESGARRLVLDLDRFDAEPVSTVLTFSRPSRDVRHLRTLLRPRLESMNLGFGVERVVLTVTRLGRLAHEQSWQRWGVFGVPGGNMENRRELDRALGEMLDTMSSRLGPDRVMRLEAVKTYIPENAYRKKTGTVTSFQGKTGTVTSFQGKTGTVTSFQGETPACAHGNQLETGDCPGFFRPSLLLSDPEPIDVMALLPDGPPSWFRWRGAEHRVVASAGPERIAGEWWRSDVATEQRSDEGTKRTHLSQRDSYAKAYARFLLGEAYEPTAQPVVQPAAAPPSPPRRVVAPPLSTRDYFSIRDEQGRWLWVYRALTEGRWFVHGLWA